jgi:FtsP/CotA-like multicopper oxidase with cupredoxin domain
MKAKTVIPVIFMAMLIGFTAAHGGDVQEEEHHETREESGIIQHETEEVCPESKASWRNATTIDGVDIAESQRCNPDNPNTVAASVKGTNNVDMETLMASGLSKDAVVKKNDRDGDGDPDDIYITLELTGINERNQSNVNHKIAPGIEPSFWTFAPKTRGMVEEDSKASELIRMPSPSIRVEEGDRVFLEIENTHYMPHTVHLHGVDHPYNSSDSNITNASGGNDGVPAISEAPIPPGESRTYEMQPREPGSMMYHCHVVPAVHVEMGLAGMFVVEEDKANNTLQTLNIGAGKVRHSSEDVKDENYASEYDMIYQGIDKEIHEIPKKYDDTRKISKKIQRDYDVTDADPDYYLLNGKSFPYTLRESIINVEKNKKYKLNTMNIGPETISLHTHGHKPTKAAVDGVKLNEDLQRDVFSISAAQRATISLNTTDNGLDSYSQGSWLMHDHTEPAVTTDGISPGGNIGMIAYQKYLTDNGLPKTDMPLDKFFSEAYYRGEVPYFQNLDKDKFGEHPDYVNDSETVNQGEGSGMNDSMSMDSMSMKTGSGMAMDMKMKPGGMVVNENMDRLPNGCSEITGNHSVYVEAGEEFAAAGNAFEYTRDQYDFNTCERVTVEFVNRDEVRHQWMLHGLPKETYPMGMFNIEADGGETVKGTFITPSEEQNMQLHCSVPQHEQKGMIGSVNIEEIEENSEQNGLFDWINSFLP